MSLHVEPFGVYVDTRLDSKTFGGVQTVHITPGVQVFVPQGVCNAFRALEDTYGSIIEERGN